jgi:superfamily II DNA or RNA helicase
MSDLFPGNRLIYHRNAAALIPEISDPDPGMAVIVAYPNNQKATLTCNCAKAALKKTCPHVGQLSDFSKVIGYDPKNHHFDLIFRQSPWFRLASVLHNADRLKPETLKVEQTVAAAGETADAITSDNNKPVRIIRSDGRPAMDYYPGSRTDTSTDVEEPELFLQRTGISAVKRDVFDHGHAWAMLLRLTVTASESMMNERGMQSIRQSLEADFWYRMAYYGFMVAGEDRVSFEPEIKSDSGNLVIRILQKSSPLMDIHVPREAVMQVSSALDKDVFKSPAIKILPQSMESILKVSVDKNNNLILTLYLLIHLPDGATEAIPRQKLKNRWFSDLVYIPHLGFAASWRFPDRFWDKFGGRYQKKIKRDRLLDVLEKLGDIFGPPHIIDESVKKLAIHRSCSCIEIAPEAMDRDWCWLSVSYGFGYNINVSLSEIYATRAAGKRYLAVDNGWVDTWAFDMKTLTDQPGRRIVSQIGAGSSRLRLSRMDILRLKAALDGDVIVSDTKTATGRYIRSLFELTPPAPVAQPDGLCGRLRDYQLHGLEWLVFLYENRFGGLLCDEMGLGKTHQVMGLMAWLVSAKKENRPFLVVCPTTVISHWERKIREHAHVLCPKVYHGIDRELEATFSMGAVLITSYGILLRDADRLAKIGFSLAIFDEAQYVKNPEAKTYEAAAILNADIKIGVTGTPVENRLGDLKALMDLVLTGYLGSSDGFADQYERGDAGERGRREALRRLIRPFALRRTKSAVLTELPEKIEDIRYCRLTDTQVKLYRQAISGRGVSLIRAIEKGDDKIPYLHIFALLTLLKQICNHPASISSDAEQDIYGPEASGKWQLFTELLETCLESDLKIVVYSQFVSMIEIIRAHLGKNNIGFAGITGQTRLRAREIDRFNNDPECRVFAGSLKAGGTGIDLTAGSVVIHYDRWWNAAREDQATDRVHRLGQTRGVQVFKLVTEGTLEEKISAMIARKKTLMADVIVENDPGLLKSFTRDDLIDLMAMPIYAQGDRESAA